MKRVDLLREAIILQVSDGYSMPAMIAERLGAKRHRVVALMNELEKMGKLVRIRRGEYSLPKPPKSIWEKLCTPINWSLLK